MEIAALITSVVAALAAAISSYITLAARSRIAHVGIFREIREYLKQNRAELVNVALEYHARLHNEKKVPLLSLPGWIQSSPTPLDEIKLTLSRRQPNADAILEATRQTAKYWPRSEAGAGIQKYSEAIAAYDKPSLWRNKHSYRLLEINPGTGPIDQPLSLTFSMGNYFDLIDTSEVLGFEAASRLVRGRSFDWARSYRSWLADPFALDQRCLIPGLNTLTVRQSSSGAHFFLHDRRAENVALSMNAIHVSPAIEFQPSVDLTPSYEADLDIWRTIMTGYVREFLGVTDAGNAGSIAADPAYIALNEAYRNGTIKLWFLGIGLDPLSWKAEIILACIFPEEVFDAIFATMIQHNPQGPLLHSRSGAPSISGLPFSRETVSTYASDPGTLPAGRACLTLAWKSREVLAITESQIGV